MQNLLDREIEQSDVDHAISQPEFIVPTPPGRHILMRRYFDRQLEQDMLLRVVVEETATEVAVVTVYRTSQIERYLRGLIP